MLFKIIYSESRLRVDLGGTLEICHFFCNVETVSWKEPLVLYTESAKDIRRLQYGVAASRNGNPLNFFMQIGLDQGPCTLGI
jgi:hypothetical protein